MVKKSRAAKSLSGRFTGCFLQGGRWRMNKGRDQVPEVHQNKEEMAQLSVVREIRLKPFCGCFRDSVTQLYGVMTLPRRPCWPSADETNWQVQKRCSYLLRTPPITFSRRYKHGACTSAAPAVPGNFYEIRWLRPNLVWRGWKKGPFRGTECNWRQELWGWLLRV